MQGSAFFLQVLRVPRHHPEHAGAGTVAAAVVQRGAGARFGSGVCRQRSGQAGVRPVRFRRFRAGRDVRPGLLALFFMLVRRAGEAESAGVRPSADSPALVEPSGDPGEPVAADPESVVLERATRFAQSYGLTNRETEVLGYLARRPDASLHRRRPVRDHRYGEDPHYPHLPQARCELPPRTPRPTGRVRVGRVLAIYDVSLNTVVHVIRRREARWSRL